MTDVFQIAAQHGLWVGTTVVLGMALAACIRRDWSRMDRLEARIESLEKEYREVLRDTIDPCAKALRDNTKLVEKFLLGS